MSSGQFDYSNAERHVAEDNVNNNSWLRHKTNDFNIEGWFIENSYLYGGLNNLVLWSFPQQNTVDLLSNMEPHIVIHPNVPRTINYAGYGPLLHFRDSSPLFQNNNDVWQNIEIDSEDLFAYKQIIEAGQSGEFQLVFVEMPVNLPSESAKNIIEDVRYYAIEQGIPFLSIIDMPPLPPTAYSDQVHMHISGSIVFSTWLGEQLGQAYANGAFDDPHTLTWQPVFEKWPDPTYLDSYGLNDSNSNQYLMFSSELTFVPENVIIFNPDEDEYDVAWLSSLIGFESEWREGVTDQERFDIYELMGILERMEYQSELDVSLDQWRITLDPMLLLDQNIDYLLCRQELAAPDILHCPLGVFENDNYKFIETWDFNPLFEQYTLFQIRK